MTNSEKVAKWLRENHKELSNHRTSGDTPATKADSEFINRSEAYEIQDIIVKFYTDNNLEFSDVNFTRTFKKIKEHKSSEKVTRKDMLKYLTSTLTKK